MIKSIVKWASSRPSLMASSSNASRRDCADLGMQFKIFEHTDEVLAFYKLANSAIEDVLTRCRCEVEKVEIRRRLSSNEFRAYVTIRTSLKMDELYDLEMLLREKARVAAEISIDHFFWQYQPKSL